MGVFSAQFSQLIRGWKWNGTSSPRTQFARLATALALVVTQVLVIPGTALANDTGSAVELVTVINTIEFISLEVDETQSLYNNSTSGTFTITFDGQTTGPIAYNATGIVVEAALEGLTNITDVTVAGTGVSGDAWVITFVDPGAQDVTQITTDDALMNGTSTPGTTQDGLSAPIDPTGVTYLSHRGSLLVSDSEIEEEPTVFDGVNLWEMTTGATVIQTGLVDELQPVKPEPTGLGYNPANKHIYVSNRVAPGILDLDPGSDGIYGTSDDSSTFLDTSAPEVAATDVEDVAWDPVSGQIFIAGGKNGTITPVGPGPNGVFDGVPSKGGDDVVGTVLYLSALVQDLEGIEYRAITDTLLITDSGSMEAIYEITKDGRLIRTINIQVLQRPGTAFKPADLAIAPASGGGGDQIYLVDSVADNNTASPPPRDGMMYELSVPFNNLAPWVDAGPDYSIALDDPLTLTGDSYDDGLPNLGAVTTTWTKVGGPGTVTFGSPSAVVTTAAFSTDGEYVLRLTADDTLLSSSDDITVTVTALPAPPPAGALEACPDTLADPGFTDLDAISDEANRAVACLVAHEITQGTSATTFSPMRSVTRWQMALFLIRQASVHGVQLPAVEQHGFTDIGDLPSTTRDAINQLATLGITEGTSATTFDPGDDVSRWQMALFLTRMADLVGVPLPASPSSQFSDLGGLTVDTQLAINQLADLGIAKGTSTTTFGPIADVLRWQMALFLTRLLDAGGVQLE